MGDTSSAHYDGLFYCHYRKGMFRWNEYVEFYKGKQV